MLRSGRTKFFIFISVAAMLMCNCFLSIAMAVSNSSGFLEFLVLLIPNSIVFCMLQVFCCLPPVLLILVVVWMMNRDRTLAVSAPAADETVAETDLE